MATVTHFFSHIWLAMDKKIMALLTGPLTSQIWEPRQFWVASNIGTGFPFHGNHGGGEAAGLLVRMLITALELRTAAGFTA